MHCFRAYKRAGGGELLAVLITMYLFRLTLSLFLYIGVVRFCRPYYKLVAGDLEMATNLPATLTIHKEPLNLSETDASETAKHLKRGWSISGRSTDFFAKVIASNGGCIGTLPILNSVTFPLECAECRYRGRVVRQR